MTVTPDEIESAFDDAIQAETDPDSTAPPPEPKPEAKEDAPPPQPEAQPEGEGDAAADAMRSFGGQLLAGKFKTPEELANAYQQLEQRLGEQGAELGQYRQLVEQAQQPQPEPPPQTDDDLARFDTWAEENPVQAAQYALQTSPQLYERVMDNWYDLDPKTASRFERGLENAAIQQQLQQTYGQPLQHVREQRQQEQILEAFAEVQTRYPDINDYAQQLQQAFETYPHLLQPLQTGAPHDRVRAIEAAYLVARGLPQPQQTPQTAPQTGATPTVPAYADKIAAAVATGHTPPGATGGAKTEAERIWEMFDQNADGLV